MVLKSLDVDVVIPEITLHDHILKAFNARRDKVGMIDVPTGRHFTFGDLADETVKCGSALFKMGLKKGDVVATATTNSPEFLIVILGASACGATVTTSNPSYTTAELKHQFQHSQPKFAFCVQENLKTIREVAASVPSLQRIFTIGETEGVDSYASLMKNEIGNAFPRVHFDVHEDVVLLPYSSGTTGVPKGVMLTHYNLIAALCLTPHSVPTTCKYTCLPVFHLGGLVTCFMTFDQGHTHVLDSRFNLENLLACVQKYKVNYITAVPPILLAIDKSPLLVKYDVSSLREILCAAAPLSPEIAKSLETKIGCAVTQVWGLTEAVSVTSHLPGQTPINSVGSVCRNTKLKVVDVTTGKELEPHQDGELCIKGPQVMKGYFKNPEATRNAIDVDGWFHTGDIAHYDEDGMIYIVDRLKELIKYKGFQVAPAEIESHLLGHPKVADAAVIGIPNPESGELPKAFIVKKDPSLTADEIHNFINDKLIKYKHLRGGIEFCSDIPKNPTGKILRRELKKREKNKSKL